MSSKKDNKKPEVERRRYPRMEAQGYSRNTSSKKEYRIINISLGGLRIQSNERMKEGKKFNLEVFLTDGIEVKSEVKVVWIFKLQPGTPGLYDVGLKFIHLPVEGYNKLKARWLKTLGQTGYIAIIYLRIEK